MVIRASAFLLLSDSRSSFAIEGERPSDRLGAFLAQDGGRFSTRASEREFKALTDDEATRIEALYKEHFGGAPPPETTTDA